MDAWYSQEDTDSGNDHIDIPGNYTFKSKLVATNFDK